MAYATQNYGSARTDLIQALRTQFEAAGYTIAGHEGESLCVKLGDDLFVEYNCKNTRYVSRGTGEYADSLSWRMGTSHNGAQVAGNTSPLESHGIASRGWSGPKQHCPLPGKLHFCKTSVSGKLDYAFCLENPTDSKGSTYVGAELDCVDPQFGAYKHFYLAGQYAVPGGSDEANPGPFHHTSDHTGPGYIRRQNADGTFHSYERAGYGINSTVDFNTINSFLPVGPHGFYDGIYDGLYFDPSLTTVLLPAIWGCVQPKSTSSDGRFGAPPKGEFSQFKVGSMKYVGIGGELVLDGKKYRLFPRIGKGGTNTAAIAIRES
ncbi:hypothetical protein [Vibrio phage vB_VpS_CA8]|nr:hypothetical protein [Vibrio phage vB_VpS_CA8]